MAIRNMKQRTARTHDFAMVPRANIPRSSFRQEHTLKTAISASLLYPIYCEEVLPGDTFHVQATVVARTATPIVPVMDNWHLTTFYFFIPMRLIWTNWQKFQGEQQNPGDSIAYTIPTVTSPAGGFAVGELYDHFGLPTVGQITAGMTVTVNALPIRCYWAVYNAWFRDENLVGFQGPATYGDGPDSNGGLLLPRGKRPDYFTSGLPFTQKGTAVSIPLGTAAPVRTSSTTQLSGVQPAMKVRHADGTIDASNYILAKQATSGLFSSSNAAPGTVGGITFYPENLYADLSLATAQTINQLRQSFQIQRLLERDARGGTRYTEIVRAHFGVISPDARLQRPEYIGGGHIPVLTTAVPQTSGTGTTGTTTPMGTLAATGHAQGRNGFTYASTEHGYILGLICLTADQTYQQGVRKMWFRSTRYDFYMPVFAMLGEQAILNKEIYCVGSATGSTSPGDQDNQVFAYQERWAEYRYVPNRINGIFRSNAAGTLDYWHTAQKFTALPTLNNTFIQDDTKTTIQRNFAGGAQTLGQQLLMDIFFAGTAARPMPMYSVPGMVDHF